MPPVEALTAGVAAAAVFCAYVVRGMSGFGTSLVATPILVYVLPIHAAIPMMSLLGLAAMLALGVRDRRHVRWEEMWRLLGPTLAGVFAGVWIFSLLDAAFMQKLLGAFILAYCAYMLAAERLRIAPRRCSARWAYPAGFSGALIDSMFGGGGGVLAVIYMHARAYERAEFRATLAVLWLIELVVRVGGYGVGGYYDTQLLLLTALLLPFMWFGNRTGERLASSMSPRAFTRLLAIVLLAAGASLLAK